MTYETLDWNLEARRLKRAFGLACECEFVESRYGKHLRKAVPPNLQPSTKVPEIAQDSRLFVGFSPHFRGFAIGGKGSRIEIELSWQGEVWGQKTVGPEPQTLRLAKGLFHLGLLTPEVEAALGVTVSSHEKLEWELKYDA